MARVKNVIENQIKTTGAEKAAKQVDKVSKSNETLTRNQTRLGQSSASAGRSFSAQASGLGGLVGVYAAAAANVFAITAAFEALGRAAQAEQIVRGTKTLALEIGQNGAQILKSVQEITQSQLTLAEASQNINIALAAGFNTQQIEDLSEVSIKASRALGRNLTDAFQRVVRGAAKLEPELLDELGIFTRIDPAVRQYAKSLNVAESSLTNYEKRQAFVNAVITEGQRKFSSISVVTDSAQKSLEQLQVALTELAIEFGQLLANGILPLINFIKDNAGVTLLAFLGILTLVFGRLGSSITAFTVGGLNNLANFTDGLATKAQKSSAAIGDLTNQVEDFNTAVKTRGGLVGKTGSLAGTGAFAGGLDRDTAQKASAARRRFAEGGATVKQQERDIKTLTRAQEQLEKAGRKNSLAFRDSQKIIETYTNAAKGATARTRAFAAVSEIASTALRGLTTVARYAGLAFNGLFGIIAITQLAGTLFDRDFLGEIKEFFFGIRQEAENLKSGLTGAVTATAGGAKQLEEQLRRLGATDTQLKELPETFRKIETQVNKTIDSINNKIKQGLIGEAGGRLQDAGIQLTPRQFEQLSSQQQKLAALQGELLKAQQDDSQQGRIRVKIIESLIKVYEDLYGATELIGAVSRELNLSNDKTAKIFKDISESSDEGIVTFKALGFSVDSTKQSFADLSAEQQKLIIANTLVVNTSNDAFEAFNAGTATAETLAKKLGGITQELNKLKENAEGLSGDALATAMSEIEDLEASRQELNGLVRSLKNLEVIGKNLTDVYGKYGKALDEAFSKGNISFRGIAKNAEAAAENQAQFLIDATEFGTKAEEVNDALAKRARIERQILTGAQEIERLNSAEVETLKNRDSAVKSIAGTVFSLALAIEKQALAQDKIVQSLKDQRDLLILQLGLVKDQNRLRLTQAQQQSANEQSAKNNDIAAARLELVKQSAEATENEARYARELNSLEQERLSILRDITDIQLAGADRSARSVREAGIAQQESRISDMQAFPGLSSTAQLQAEQRELIRLQYENEIEIIAAKERQAERDKSRALEEIESRRKNINNEIDAAKKQREFAVNRQKDEMALLEATQALELQKLEDQKANLEIQQDVAKSEALIAERRVKATEAQFAFENKAREIQVKAIEFQALVVDKLSEVLNDDNSAFVSAIRTYVEAIGGDASAIQPSEVISNLAADAKGLRDEFGDIQKLQEQVVQRQRELNKEQFDSATALNEEQKNRLTEVIRLTKTQFQLQKDLANAKNTEELAEIDNAINLNNKKLDNLKLESDRAEELFNDKKTQFDEERALAKRNADEQLRNLERIKKTLGDLANAISEDLQKGFENVVTTVFDNIATGQDVGKGLKEALVSTFEDVRKSVLQETLIEPGKEFIKEQIGGLFGLEQTQGIDAVQLEAGAVPVVVKGSAGDDILDAITEEGNNAFQEIGNKLGEFGQGAKDTFSELGTSVSDTFSNVGSGISNMFKSIFSGASSGGGFGSILSAAFSGGGAASDPSVAGASIGSSPFGEVGRIAASGGIIRQMAAGGMLRDRVPALLEPGEFVMKRSATKGIGEPALNRMNATGAAGGNVVVNIKNEGTPQDATASQPRFDGEKFVIDIVTRDLRNNGPIRKSMRGGS